MGHQSRLVRGRATFGVGSCAPPPELGGNLRGALPEPVEDVAIRAFAAGSGVAAGVVVGVLCGLVARALIARTGHSGAAG